MASFRLTVDLGHLVGLRAAISRETFPTLAQAVQQVSEAAHRRWHAVASGREAMPDGQTLQPRSGEYARSILLKQTGDFSAEVFSMLPYAAEIEDGSPARDLKRILNTSLKVRVSAKGRRYLIIPFRHGHPKAVMGNAMPANVHGWWRQKGRVSSHTTAEYLRPSGTGAHHRKTRELLMVPAWKYKWGTRLSKADLAGKGVTGNAAKRLQGMVRFQKPGGKGGSSHTQFITFRVMTEGTKGWIAPARAGKHPARQIAEELRPVAERVFSEAMKKDIALLFG